MTPINSEISNHEVSLPISRKAVSFGNEFQVINNSINFKLKLSKSKAKYYCKSSFGARNFISKIRLNKTHYLNLPDP